MLQKIYASMHAFEMRDVVRRLNVAHLFHFI